LSGAGTRNQQKSPARGFLFVYYDLCVVVNTCMSWFKRIPHKYPPAPSVTAPHRSSPATDRALEEAKETRPKKSLAAKSSKTQKSKQT
jgi:hypothetical protein